MNLVVLSLDWKGTQLLAHILLPFYQHHLSLGMQEATPGMDSVLNITILLPKQAQFGVSGVRSGRDPVESYRCTLPCKNKAASVSSQFLKQCKSPGPCRQEDSISLMQATAGWEMRFLQIFSRFQRCYHSALAQTWLNERPTTAFLRDKKLQNSLQLQEIHVKDTALPDLEHT